MNYIERHDPTSSVPVRLYYEDWGSGRPVVFIHGWPHSHEMWEYQLNELPKQGLRCIAYDRRGFGKSSRTWTGYDYDSLADDLSAVLDALDLQDVVLVGFSMGGGEVARYFARHGSARVSKAVLLSAVTPYLYKTEDNPEGVDPEVFAGIAEQIEKDRTAFLSGFAKQFFGVGMLSHPVSDEFLQYFQTVCSQAAGHATLECAKAFSQTDFRADMAKITVPTLVLHGDSDQTVPFEVSGKRAAKMVPNAKLIVYEGAPHGLFATHHERLTEDLLEFCSQ